MLPTVLVTRVSGYIGLYVTEQLLQAGYSVRGCVRSKAKAQEVYDTLLKDQVDVDQLTM